jgi:hypothetical protein
MLCGRGKVVPRPHILWKLPMNQSALQAYFRLGMLIAVGSVLLLMVQQPETAEYVVTVLSLCIGVLLMALVALVARLM